MIRRWAPGSHISDSEMEFRHHLPTHSHSAPDRTSSGPRMHRSFVGCVPETHRSRFLEGASSGRTVPQTRHEAIGRTRGLRKLDTPYRLRPAPWPSHFTGNPAPWEAGPPSKIGEPVLSR